MYKGYYMYYVTKGKNSARNKWIVTGFRWHHFILFIYAKFQQNPIIKYQEIATDGKHCDRQMSENAKTISI
jgi:hypothetical protein